MGQTIEEIKNYIMGKAMKYAFTDQVYIFREVENFCGQQADEAMKMEYDLSEMEDMNDE